LIVVDDLTEQERRELAEREIVSNAAHELRTPLTTIIGAVEGLQAGAEEDPPARDPFPAHTPRQAGPPARPPPPRAAPPRAPRRPGRGGRWHAHAGGRGRRASRRSSSPRSSARSQPGSSRT